MKSSGAARPVDEGDVIERLGADAALARSEA